MCVHINDFRKGKLEYLALTERKLKGTGEVSWCTVVGNITGAHEIERAREGVDVLMNYVWYSTEIDFECVSSRFLWIKFKFSRV